MVPFSLFRSYHILIRVPWVMRVASDLFYFLTIHFFFAVALWISRTLIRSAFNECTFSVSVICACTFLCEQGQGHGSSTAALVVLMWCSVWQGTRALTKPNGSLVFLQVQQVLKCNLFSFLLPSKTQCCVILQRKKFVHNLWVFFPEGVRT